MALNVTTAVFRPGFNIATASPSLVQWDQGQTLQFEGVELPSAYQVEFTNAVTVQAITMIGNENGVEIPNELLQQSFPINAYIVLHETAEDRETEYWATIYVKARQQPREETPDPEQSSVIDQTIAALQEGVAEAQAASQAVQNMGVEAETLPEGSEATVEKTVDPETGEVTLEFGIPEGRHGATGATPDIQIGTVTTGAPGSQADASITGTREEPRLNLKIPQGPQGDAGVTSVNGKTGAVVLSASDVGAKPASYEAPVSSINGKTGAVVLDASDVGAKPASYEAPVSSVNGRTGAVVLDASDVGAKPASYEAPVSSVNEKTGAVVLDAGDIGYESTTVEDELGTINSALSSLESVTEIIDTASGAIASFPDGSGLPMRSLVAEINPVQDLHGQSSPYPMGGGTNLMTTDGSNLPFSQQGVTITIDDNFVYNIVASNASGYPYARVCTFHGLKAGTYTISVSDKSAELVSSNFNVRLIDRSVSPSNIIASVISGQTSFTLAEDYANDVYAEIALTGSALQNGNYAVKLQLEKGSTASAWSPYANICPISGWTGAQGEVDGKNLIDPSKRYNYQANTHRWYFYEGFTLKAGVTYTLSSYPSGAYTYIIDKETSAVYAQGNSKCTYTPTTDVTVYFQIYSSSGATGIEVQLELGSTNTDFVPYTGEAISVSWQSEAGTVYGGSDEVVGGELTSTHELSNLRNYNASRINTYDYNGKHGVYFQYGYSITADRDSGLCNVAVVSTTADNPASHYMWFGVNSNHVFWIGILDALGMTLEEFKTWITQNDVIITRRLSTPQSFTHTGQSVDTLVGQNNVWVDTGDVSVTYQASIKGYIDKVLAS